MHRPEEEFFGLGHLDQLADVQDGDPVSEVLDDAEAMRDEHVRRVELAPEIRERVQDLGPDRDVERQCPGDPDALPLAAAERVRVATHVLGPQTDSTEQLGAPILKRSAGRAPVHFQQFADDLEDRHPWIQRRVWMVKDHPDLAAVRLELPSVESGHADSRPLRAQLSDTSEADREADRDAATVRLITGRRASATGCVCATHWSWI